MTDRDYYACGNCGALVKPNDLRCCYCGAYFSGTQEALMDELKKLKNFSGLVSPGEVKVEPLPTSYLADEGGDGSYGPWQRWEPVEFVILHAKGEIRAGDFVKPNGDGTVSKA